MLINEKIDRPAQSDPADAEFPYEHALGLDRIPGPKS